MHVGRLNETRQSQQRADDDGLQARGSAGRGFTGGDTLERSSRTATAAATSTTPGRHPHGDTPAREPAPAAPPQMTASATGFAAVADGIGKILGGIGQAITGVVQGIVGLASQFVARLSGTA